MIMMTTEEKMTQYQIYADTAREKSKQAQINFRMYEEVDEEMSTNFYREAIDYLNVAQWYEKEIREMLEDEKRGVD